MIQIFQEGALVGVPRPRCYGTTREPTCNEHIDRRALRCCCTALPRPLMALSCAQLRAASTRTTTAHLRSPCHTYSQKQPGQKALLKNLREFSQASQGRSIFLTISTWPLGDLESFSRWGSIFVFSRCLRVFFRSLRFSQGRQTSRFSQDVMLNERLCE